MRKKVSLFIIVAMLAVFAAACGTKEEEKTSGTKSEKITVKHELGETKVAKNPKKVVVFDFGSLDTLDKLGVEIAGLPQENVPKYLSKYEDKKYANLGGLKDPDFEKINELQPDLIIISGRQQDSYDQFSEIAPTIYMAVDTNKYMESFEGNVQTLAKIFDKEKEANTELDKIKKDVAALKDKGEATDKSGLIILANDGKVSAYGPASRFGIIHDEFGIKPVDKNIEVSTHGQSISMEYISEKNPDYLFVVDRGAVAGDGASSAKSVVENDLVKKTNAFKDGHIVYLDPDYWYLSGGGLESVASMVKEVDSKVK